MNFMGKQEATEFAKRMKPHFTSNRSIQSSPSRSQTSQLSECNRKQLVLQRQESAPAILQNKLQITQKSKFETGDHTFRYVILFVICSTIAIFLVDLHKEMHQEKIEHDIKRKRCYDEYLENQCENPVQAMRQICHELEVCYSTRAEEAVRMTHSAAKLIGRLTEIFLKETGYIGAFVVLIVLSMLLIFMYKLGKTAQTHQTTVKKD